MRIKIDNEHFKNIWIHLYIFIDILIINNN